MEFEWDPRKEQGNQKNHGISFNEAATAFDDELQLTISDPDHSLGEQRYLTIATDVSSSYLTQRMLMIAFASSAREVQPLESGEPMKKVNDVAAGDDMRDEYDFRGGVRGKYFERYRRGTNLVLLEPDLAKVFRDSEAVNRALRQFLSEHAEPPASIK